MNGKQLFCVSLILLSIAMGIQWSKNKPKRKKKKKNRPRVALNLEDLQIKDEKKTPEDTDSQENTETTENNENSQAEVVASDSIEASSTIEIASQTNGSATNQLASESDPILLAFMKLERNPFQKSPYAKLVEEIRALQQQPEDTDEDIQKVVKKIEAKFDSTIKSKGKLIAIIDSQLYREGDEFQGKKITKITRELVSIDSPTSLWLIPKVGTKLSIASDGTYNISDPFLEN